MRKRSDDIPDLEQDFRSHTEEAVDDTEREDHWHAIDKPRFRVHSVAFQRVILIVGSQTQEPRQRSNRELDVDFLEMVVDHGKAFLDE